MGGSSNISLLAGLVHGYTSAKDAATKQDLDMRGTQRDQILQYLGHLASNPNVPVEHQQWALSKIQEGVQHDITKKPWKVDLADMPAVMRQPPDRQMISQTPGMTLQPPTAPPQVGQAANGTVNALGAASGAASGVQMPQPPPGMSPNASGQPNNPAIAAATAPAPAPPLMNMPPANVPPGPATVITNPQPPQQIAPGGQVHLMTPQEKAQQNLDVTQSTINSLQKQYPTRSQEELAYFAQHGEFPKPQDFTLGTGQARYDAQGKEIARNDEEKPGGKSGKAGFSVGKGSAGQPIIKNNATGADLTPEQVQANPEAKKLFDAENAAQSQKEKQQEDKEDRQFRRQVDLLNTREDASLNRQVTGGAVKMAIQAKAMVDVLDTSERYMRTGNFSPRQDLALIVRAVRAMNPGTVRLPNKELELEIKAGSYGDRFGRWYSSASTGLLPPDQRNDLMTVIREETTQTAKSAADNWQQSFKGKQPVPTFLKRFTGEGQVQKPSAPPTSATTAPTGAINVTAPDGSIHAFPDQKSADAFKQAAGIK